MYFGPFHFRCVPGPALCPAAEADGVLLLCRTDDGVGAPPPAEDGEPVGVGAGSEGGGVRGGVGDADGGGAVLGGGVAVPPRIVMTVPPGAKATRLVHWPDGAALVAVAVMAWDRPAPRVPAL